MSDPLLAARQADGSASIGVVFETDPGDSGVWPGVPASLSAALREVGVGVEAISAQPPRALYPMVRDLLALTQLGRTRRPGAEETIELSRLVADLSPEMARFRPAALERRLRSLDGLVQIGSNVSPPTSGPPFVSFEDMTIAQVTRHPYPGWAALSPTALAGRQRRQRAIFRRARACCVASPWAARSVITDYGVPADKVHVVGFGRNHEFGPGCREWHRPRFLFVGLDWQRKNGEGLLRAFARLRRRNPDARLDVVSHHPPTAARSSRCSGTSAKGPAGASTRRLRRCWRSTGRW